MPLKLYSRRALSRLTLQAQKKGKRIVFTNGCFDILHAGHVDYLERAKAFGDLLVVGLNSDASVRKLKGAGRPINSERDRARVLSALTSVDFITIFNEETPRNLIRAVQPDVLVKGADWKLSEISGAAEVKKRGGTVRRVRLLKGRSTTNVLTKVKRKFLPHVFPMGEVRRG